MLFIVIACVDSFFIFLVFLKNMKRLSFLHLIRNFRISEPDLSVLLHVLSP